MRWARARVARRGLPGPQDPLVPQAPLGQPDPLVLPAYPAPQAR